MKEYQLLPKKQIVNRSDKRALAFDVDRLFPDLDAIEERFLFSLFDENQAIIPYAVTFEVYNVMWQNECTRIIKERKNKITIPNYEYFENIYKPLV